MKRTICILLSLITLLSLAACQATPEEAIVVKKDTERMIEKAQELIVDDDKNLREQYEIPQTYQFESQGKGNLKVISNVKINVPESNNMPIINVRSGVFSQELVSRLWKELIGDSQMWELSQQPTKDTIAEMIIKQKQLLADAASKNDTESVKVFNSNIAELERMYTSAPQTTDVATCDGKLKELLDWDPVSGKIDARYLGLRSCSLKSQVETSKQDAVYKWFSVHNPWQGESGSVKSDVTPAQILFETQAIANNYGMGLGVTIAEHEQLGETIKPFLKMSPRQAKEKVLELFRNLNMTLAVNEIKIISDGWNMQGKLDNPKHYAYQLECIRLVNGFAIGGQGNTMESDATYNKPWYYEYITATLDDNGFISLNWSSPLEILSTEIENSKLLNFDEIKAIFEKMVFTKYEPSIEKNQSKELNMSHVNLELMRIIKQNTNLEGILIPVWNFYSSIEDFDANGNLIGGGKQFVNIILSINAIDGSIIDISKGY